jgi:hypothetical protein
VNDMVEYVARSFWAGWCCPAKIFTF